MNEKMIFSKLLIFIQFILIFLNSNLKFSHLCFYLSHFTGPFTIEQIFSLKFEKTLKVFLIKSTNRSILYYQKYYLNKKKSFRFNEKDIFSTI